MIIQVSGFCQSRAIPGIVIDSTNNEPIIAANIYDIQNNVLYQSDFDGNFEITLNQREATRLYTNRVGYPRRITVVSDTTNAITIYLISVPPGGIQDHLRAKKYYEKNKKQIDSLNTMYDKYDEMIKTSTRIRKE